MALSKNLSIFRNSISDCMEFISFAHQKYVNSSYKINSDLRKFISEADFLKIFVAWEVFLERSFIDYLMGEPSKPYQGNGHREGLNS